MLGLLSLALRFFRSQLRPLPVPTTSYAGRTVIVTGGNGGLGLEAARHFARLGAARVILACRRVDSGEAAKADIEKSLSLPSGSGSPSPSSAGVVVEVWPLDLCSFDSVRAFCRRAEAELSRLDVLLMNAAVLNADCVEMAEGYEVQVTTNVISTFLMVLMLLPLMKRTAAKQNVETVVTVVSSEAHSLTRFAEKDQPRIFECFRPGSNIYERYSTAKLLDVLIVRELAERLDAASPGGTPVVVNTANPGLCRSRLFRDIPSFARFLLAVPMFLIGRTLEQGSRALMAAVAGGRESHGQYVDSGRVDMPSPFVVSQEGKTVQKRVWDELMEILEGIVPGVTANVGQAP
ncbi:uncharacterized protein THITE_2153165 [Thermothielavioides terrestris NRRL 8126]|uniref:Uncharacterized protein n=1 Tax=Thermothielavioides terrestris (strain ATCC 38088 / NRRL 8126) TaxID=578455 RepID=G2QRP1_THETT|nr:uncharacterized protein THITE_2153165 [Thermothielavioides terrestris NRRL 8126]AEO63388.1 hypothetical protein THITE_2153165 [Thermothielavioides terrestris NRRL 8126]